MTNLVERLRKQEVLDLSNLDHVRKYLDRDSLLHHEAATALEAKDAEISSLRAECFKLAADTCHAGYGDEYGHHRCREVDAAEARAETAERDRDEAISLRHFVLSHWDNQDMNHKDFRVNAYEIAAARAVIEE